MPIVNVMKEKELKNAYIGGYYEYSYNFKNKSSADITNDGWEIYWSSVTTSSNWVTCSTSTDMNMLFPVDVADAKKITIEATATYIQNNSHAFVFGLQLEDAQWSSNYVDFYIASNTTYNWTKVRINKSWTQTSWTNIGSIGTSTYTPKLEIDLENKLITWTISGYSNSTLSLADADVSFIRTMKFLWFYTTQGTFYLQWITIKIEK